MKKSQSGFICWYKMNEYDLLKMVSELAKDNIDHNLNLNTQEKWCRKSGIEITMQIVKRYYNHKE